MNTSSNSEPNFTSKKEASSESQDAFTSDNLPPFDENQFYEALSHEIRRDIILLTGREGFAGFSSIKKLTHASTGAIYHHLEVLNDFLTQNAKKKYQLTPLGQQAYEFLIRPRQPEEPSPPDGELLGFSLENTRFLKHLFFHPLVEYMQTHHRMAGILSQSVIILIALLCSLFDFQAYLFFYAIQSPIWNLWIESRLLSGVITFFSVILGYYFILGISEGLNRLLFGKTMNWKQLWRNLGLVYLPLLIYVILLSMVKLIMGSINTSPFILRLLFILFQLWSMLILAYLLTVYKQLQFEKALLIAIFIDYGTLILLIASNISVI